MNLWTLIDWVRLGVAPEGGGNDAGDGGDGGAQGGNPDNGAHGDAGSGELDGGDGDAGADDGVGGAQGADGDPGGKGKPAGDGKDDGPKTMLEAIERGLSKEPAKPADGANKDPKLGAKDEGKDKGKDKDDPDLLKTPEGLTPKAQERFQNLVAKNRDLSAEAKKHADALAETQGTLSAFSEEMRRTQTTPEDLEVFFGFKEALAAGKFDDAASILLAQAKHLQLLSGKAIDFSTHDPLADFPDLQADVADLKITQERAMELAKGRASEARAENARRQQEDQQRQQGATQAIKDDAINKVKAWANQMASSDIDYKAKEGRILAKLQTIAKTYPPGLWLTRIQEEYAAIGGVAAPAAAAGGKDNALRGGVGGGGGKPAPKDMYEAIGQGLNWG